jgi:hypothetical protein
MLFDMEAYPGTYYAEGEVRTVGCNPTSPKDAPRGARTFLRVGGERFGLIAKVSP